MRPTRLPIPAALNTVVAVSGGDAADASVAHHVEDRPGMRRATGEVRERDRDELRRAQRLRYGQLRAAIGCRLSVVRLRGRLPTTALPV